MAIDLRLTSSAPPDRVLDAIRGNTREWRESVIPRDLWAGGVLQVVADVSPPDFTIRYDRRWRNTGGDALRLKGSVRANADGGTEVVARCGAKRGLWVLACVFLFFGAENIIRGDGTSWWGWALVAAAMLAIDGWNDRAVSRDDPEAAYLVQRLEQAVSQASVAPHTAAT